MQFLETLLLPKVHEPHPFVFFKVINVGKNPFYNMKQVYVTHKDHYSPYIATVVECSVFDCLLMFIIHSDKQDAFYGVNTDEHYIMENDEIEGDPNTNVEIGDQAENELIQLMKQYPSIKKKIPQELKDHPSFKRKVDMERTKGILKITNSSGLFLHDKLPHEVSGNINDMLGRRDPMTVHAARRQQTRHHTPPQENARASWFSRFRRMLGRGTRKNKKKRYGRV